MAKGPRREGQAEGRVAEGRPSVGARGGRTRLDVEQILAWADRHRRTEGVWPDRGSGPVLGVPGETWRGIDAALADGRRGLPGGSSLARLLAEGRGVSGGANPESPADRLRAWEAEQFPKRRPRRDRSVERPRAKTRLSIDLILSWADDLHAATGRWPRSSSDPVRQAPELNWSQVNRALAHGSRGLPGGTTLADLLQERRGVRNKQNLPRLDVEQILAWADAHREATGEYPQGNSGPVRDAPGETWSGVNSALWKGLRGLPGGSSLLQLLEGRRDYRGPLTIDRILAWADAHREADGRWPTSWSSGPVRDAPGETWPSIDSALREGRRGLSGGTTLARLLAEHRQAPNIYTEPPLTIDRILGWAEAHRESNGRWPSSQSGPVLHAEGEHWGSVDTALREGYRGLPGGQSLGRLIRGHGGPDAYRTRPELTIEQILAWADAHREANGRWPTEDSGPVRDAPGENWGAISTALAKGSRGLPGGSSLARLLDEYRGARNPKSLPRLTIKQILAWADAYHEATGRWPSSGSGPVAGAAGETWARINSALVAGNRGLRGGSSLTRLLDARRPARKRRLTMSRIRSWAEAHRQATGRWPDANAGPVADAPGESWSEIDDALRYGRRGLPGGTTLARLFGRSINPDAIGPRPPLTVDQILAWADAHRESTGRWPTRTSGPVLGEPGEKWVNLDAALQIGRRGLPGGTSLARLLAERRGVPRGPASRSGGSGAAPGG